MFGAQNGIWKMKVAAVLLGISLLLCGCAEDQTEKFWSPQADAEDGLQRALTGAVEIEAGGWSGSGVIYEAADEGLVIVTAAHVMADAPEQVRVSFYDGWEACCSVYQVFYETDCAFLSVEYEEMPADCRERYVAAQKDRESFDSVTSGEGMFLSDPENENDFGYRFAMLSESWIYVEDFGQYMMLLSGEAAEGMSGSGVYDESGCFMGILCGQNEENDLAVLPYSIVDAMYRQIEMRNE